MTARMLVARATDTGRHRKRNEDTVAGVTWSDHDGGDASTVVLAVADGMGGSAGGQVASQTAIAALESGLSNWRALGRLASQHEWLAAFNQIFDDVIVRLRQAAARDAELTGMGTTLTCVAITGDRIVFGHVGDTRAYLLRAGQLRRLTTDHNAATELASEGRIGAADIATHKSRHVLTRWLAPDASAALPEIGGLGGQLGDLALVCSDGLHSVLPDDDIAAILGRYSFDHQAGLDQAAAALVESANSQGTRDNISVVLGAHTTP